MATMLVIDDAALALDGAQSLWTDRVAQAPPRLIHPHERGIQDLLEPLILPHMMHVDGFDTDGEISHEGGINLIGAPKGDVIEAHNGTYRCF